LRGFSHTLYNTPWRSDKLEKRKTSEVAYGSNNVILMLNCSITHRDEAIVYMSWSLRETKYMELYSTRASSCLSRQRIRAVCITEFNCNVQKARVDTFPPYFFKILISVSTNLASVPTSCSVFTFSHLTRPCFVYQKKRNMPGHV
jgi:hypothetical protein